MGFATGFITGLAKSVDDNLKKDMQRTQDRIDGMAQYRITRRRAELERKDKEKEELRDTLTNLASLVGGDIDKAAQIYKGAGGTISSANEFFKLFGITNERLKYAAKNVIIMHPGPINRGIEISDEVADGDSSVILNQVTNGIAVRMAVMATTLSNRADSGE